MQERVGTTRRTKQAIGDDKRTYEEIVDHMILPLQWERRQHPSPPMANDAADGATHADSVSHNETGDTLEQAACALREEMEHNSVLTQQWLIMRALLAGDALDRYTEACRRIGIPEHPNPTSATDTVAQGPNLSTERLCATSHPSY
jgi:hypothetical protein